MQADELEATQAPNRLLEQVGDNIRITDVRVMRRSASSKSHIEGQPAYVVINYYVEDDGGPTGRTSTANYEFTGTQVQGEHIIKRSDDTPEFRAVREGTASKEEIVRRIINHFQESGRIKLEGPVRFFPET